MAVWTTIWLSRTETRDGAHRQGRVEANDEQDDTGTAGSSQAPEVYRQGGNATAPVGEEASGDSTLTRCTVEAHVVTENQVTLERHHAIETEVRPEPVA
jgi:hypothetical protein